VLESLIAYSTSTDSTLIPVTGIPVSSPPNHQLPLSPISGVDPLEPSALIPVFSPSIYQ
jgi:hypothetical protein